MKLKLPAVKGKKGKRIVLVSSISVAAVVAVFIILYFTNSKFKRKVDSLLKRGGPEGPIVETAANVQFDIPQDRVPPNTEFTLVGEFTDAEGKPVRVKQGLYYIIQNASGESGPRELLMQGTLGSNVNKFSKVVSTSGFPRGNDYDVVVTDTPLNVSDIQGTGKEQGPGLGEGGGFPLGIGEGDREGPQVRQSQKLGISGLT